MLTFSRYLEESSYALLQVFSEKYGRFLVYGDAYDFVPRQDDFDFMQKTFNEMCFNGKLHRIPILCITLNALKKRYSGFTVNCSLDEIADDFGAYISRIDFLRNKLTNEVVCSIQDEAIYVNSSNGEGALLAAATIVCHEMAHQYDAWFGEYTELLFNEQQNGKIYDHHTTKTFEELSSKISRQGIDIMQKVDGMTYKQLSQKIVKRAVELGESKLDSKKYEKLFEILAFAR